MNNFEKQSMIKAKYGTKSQQAVLRIEFKLLTSRDLLFQMSQILSVKSESCLYNRNKNNDRFCGKILDNR
eukprot:877309-Amphidinium_carterae.1